MSRLSVVLPLWQDRPPRENLAIATTAEQLGYRHLWIGEMATYDAFALATHIGTDTSFDITVGPLAVAVRTPTSIAMGVASASDLIGRRVNVAVGASSPVVVQQWHGRPWHETARQLEESVDIVRVLLEGGRSRHHGDRASSEGYRLRLEPPGAHITVAAFGPKALRVAAERGDRVVLNMLTAESVARIAQMVSEWAWAARRPTPPLAVWLTASVDPTTEAHVQMARARLSYLSAPGYTDMIRQAGFGELVDLAVSGVPLDELQISIPPELDDAVGLAGSPHHVDQRIAQYRAAGAAEICLVPVTAGDPGGGRTLTALHPCGQAEP